MGGLQYIRLGTRTDIRVATHEIGHAAGLYHEQNRKDRDKFVKVLWDNIKKEYAHNFYIMGDTIGNYDFHSIMHYGRYSFSNNRKPTLQVIDGKNNIENEHISEGDVEAVRRLYNF
jgi:hypothetical protein